MTQDLNKMVSKRLKELSKNVGGKDKIDACYSLGFSRPTIDKYLKGDVAKVDIGEKLIVFFTERINQRLENITAA